VNPFKLERYLAQHEFSAPYVLCCSDAESIGMKELVQMADAEMLHHWQNLRLQYTESQGMPLLRQEIARVCYPGLTHDNILCFAGAQEGIYAALRVLCKPGDHVIVLTPCYQSLRDIPKVAGAEVTCVALRAEEQWRINVTRIAAAMRPTTRCIIINFPHNPTGQIITAAELDNLVALCRMQGIWLFSDEVYRLLGTTTEWAPAAAVVYERALSLGVMSKAFGLAGLRIGWIACQDVTLLNAIKEYKDYLSICSSSPSEILACMALRKSDYLLTRNNQIVAANKEKLRAFFAQYAHLFSWVEPLGGCTGFVRYHGAQNIEALCADAVMRYGVLLLPGSVYDVAEPYFRIGFGRSNFVESLQRFEEYVDGL